MMCTEARNSEIVNQQVDDPCGLLGKILNQCHKTIDSAPVAIGKYDEGRIDHASMVLSIVVEHLNAEEAERQGVDNE